MTDGTGLGQDGGMGTERRLLLAVALSVLVMVGWSWLFAPETPTGPPPQAAAPLPAPIVTPIEPAPAAPAEDLPPVDAVPVAAAAEETVTVTTDLIQATFVNRGAVSTSWKLLTYTTPDGAPLELWPVFQDRTAYPFTVELLDPNLASALNGALYEVARSVPEGAAPGTQRVAFTWADGRGVKATKAFTFHPDSFVVDVEVDVSDRGRNLPARLVVGPGLSAQEHREGRSNYYYAGSVLWNVGGQVAHRKPGKLADREGLSGDVRWAGLEDQFFAALILPGDRPAEVAWSKVQQIPAAEPGAEEAPDAIEQAMVSVSVGPSGARMFVGPKQYTMLRELGGELEKSVWFSDYGWLGWIVKQLYLALVWLNDHVAHNYGLAIVLATLVLRIVLFPVNQYSMVSMKKSQLQMQKLQPKIKAIRAKYKKVKDVQSRQKMNQETMDLYKREGVNPMGGVTGCLPMLAQFPILIGFYNMLTVAVELRGAPFFGWIQDLSVKDPYWVTPLLMGATMFVQQKMAMSKIKDPQQLQQQRMMLFMPFMFTFICLQMPSGLVLYWFVNNVLGIGQQWLVNHHTSRFESEPVVKKPRRVAEETED